MAYSTLKAAIQAVIKQNGNNEITGPILQQALLSMINSLGDGYQFKGVATPATNPGTPDQNVFYIASEVGTYSNFGLSVGENEVAVFLWNGSWSKQSTEAASAEAVNQLGQKIDKEIGQENEQYINLTSADYSNVAWNGTNFFDASTGNYNGFVLKVFPGQEITFIPNYIPSNSYTLSDYPTAGSAPIKRNVESVAVDKKITIQNDECYLFIGNVKLTTFTSYGIYLSSFGIKRDIKDLDTRVTVLESKDKPLTGKTIVCFGDSITEFANGDNKRYSDYIELFSGASVINVGVGGSRLRQRETPTLTPSSESEAFAALDIVNMIKASCTQDFTYQQAAATYLDARPGEEGQKQAILDRLEGIDWSNVDAITILGGTNDWNVNSASGALGQSGSLDENYILGAINKINQLFCTTYPNIKVYWFTPIIRYLGRPSETFDSSKWGDIKLGVGSKTLKEFCEIVTNEVLLSHIPVCDMYNMGWNQYNMINYFPSNDGTHPKTVKGFTFIAKKIIGFIYSENTI